MAATATIEGAPFAPPDRYAMCVRPVLDFAGVEPATRWVFCVADGQTGSTGSFADVMRVVGKAVALPV